ncbi:hypothetical protein BJX63DRAFT_232183 [Aspergillus granulosus]|uniref:Uncharacterized protein n=1 Tax=Aspergillus granulosus TaxID=176169 RepID=A0ABR4HCF5_9EURO
MGEGERMKTNTPLITTGSFKASDACQSRCTAGQRNGKGREREAEKGGEGGQVIRLTRRQEKGNRGKSWGGSRGGNGLGSCAVRTQRAETCPEKAACTARRRAGTRATKNPRPFNTGPRAMRGCGVLRSVSYGKFRFERPDSLQPDPPCRRILFLRTESARISDNVKTGVLRSSIAFFFPCTFSKCESDSTSQPQRCTCLDGSRGRPFCPPITVGCVNLRRNITVRYQQPDNPQTPPSHWSEATISQARNFLRIIPRFT